MEPDSVTWSEEGPSGKNGVWFGHTGDFGFPDGADPRREWLRLVWHRAHRLVAPEVMDYEDDEWAHGICRRIAKWIDAEAVTLEAETTRREPAGGATGTEGKAEARDGPEPPDSFNHGGKEYSGLARKPFLAVCFLWGRRNKKARRDELAQPVGKTRLWHRTLRAFKGCARKSTSSFAQTKSLGTRNSGTTTSVSAKAPGANRAPNRGQIAVGSRGPHRNAVPIRFSFLAPLVSHRSV